MAFLPKLILVNILKRVSLRQKVRSLSVNQNWKEAAETAIEYQDRVLLYGSLVFWKEQSQTYQCPLDSNHDISQEDCIVIDKVPPETLETLFNRMKDNLVVLVVKQVKDYDYWLTIVSGLSSKIECVEVGKTCQNLVLPRLLHWTGTPENLANFNSIFHAQSSLQFASIYTDYRQHDWVQPALKTFPVGIIVLDLFTPCCGDFWDISVVTESPAVKRSVRKLSIRSSASTYAECLMYGKGDYDDEYVRDHIQGNQLPNQTDYSLMQEFVIWGDPNRSDYQPLAEFMKKCINLRKLWLLDFWVEPDRLLVDAVSTLTSLQKVRLQGVPEINSIIQTICRSSGQTLEEIYEQGYQSGLDGETITLLAHCPNLSQVILAADIKISFKEFEEILRSFIDIRRKVPDTRTTITLKKYFVPSNETEFNQFLSESNVDLINGEETKDDKDKNENEGD